MSSELATMIGTAAFEMWPDLPREIQEVLFETAVRGRDDVRQALAIYLHDHHPRTAHPAKPAVTV
jgi:hypothetical protein